MVHRRNFRRPNAKLPALTREMYQQIGLQPDLHFGGIHVTSQQGLWLVQQLLQEDRWPLA